MTISDPTATVEIRTATLDDAAALLDLKLALDHENDFMMLEPGERVPDVDAERAHLGSVLASTNSTVLVADAGAELAGYLEAIGGEFRRNRHVVEIVVGVRAAYGGRGIGRQCFEQLEIWARGAGIHRLELTVMTHNARAIRLYERAGFEVEGVRRDSLRLNGRYVDEFAMARLLNHAPADDESGPFRA